MTFVEKILEQTISRLTERLAEEKAANEVLRRNLRFYEEDFFELVVIDMGYSEGEEQSMTEFEDFID